MIPSLWPAEQFRLFTKPELIPERGEVTAYVLQWDTNQFTFMPPANWQVKSETMEKKVNMMPRDLSVSIGIQIRPGHAQSKTPLQPDPLREEIVARFPSAKILLEHPSFTSEIAGYQFDLEQIAGNETKMSTSIAFVPYGSGMVEFAMTTATKRYDEFKIAFRNVLSSFRVEIYRAEPSRP